MANRWAGLFLVGLAGCLPASCSVAATADVRDSVVKIYTTRRTPSFSRPWTRSNATEVSGSGAIIAGNRILTNAHVVLYASRVMVQAHRSPARVRAKIVAIAPGMDLALLEVSDPSFFEGRPPLPLATERPKVKETVNAYGYPIGGEQISVTEGIVSRIEYVHYRYGVFGLRIQVDAALNSGNSGGPALVDGKIVGVVFSRVGNADNIGYLIPTEEVEIFLKDIEDGRYDGKPVLLDAMQTVENPALRQRLKLDVSMGGMMIQRPLKEDESYPLKDWDVIIKVDEYDIDRQGRVTVGDALRVSFQYLLPAHTKDNKIGLTVWRDGKSLQVEAPVQIQRPLLIPYLKGRYPRHFILGPLVFTEASQELIAAFGHKGLAALNARKSPLVRRQFDRPAFPGEELVILVPRTFSHPLTEGYDNPMFAVVTQVNDVKIRNMAHFVETVRDATGEFIVFDFAGTYERQVYRREELIEATEEILEDEGIRYQCSPDLEKIWRGK